MRGWHHGVKRVVLRIQTDPEAEIPRPWLVWFVLTGWMKVWRWRKWLFINWHELWVDNTSPYLDMILPTVGMECGRRRHMSFRKAIMPKSNLRPNNLFMGCTPFVLFHQNWWYDYHCHPYCRCRNHHHFHHHNYSGLIIILIVSRITSLPPVHSVTDECLLIVTMVIPLTLPWWCCPRGRVSCTMDLVGPWDNCGYPR